MSKLLTDPLFYLNYFFMFVALYLIFKGKRLLDPRFLEYNPVWYAVHLIALVASVAGCLYLMEKLGDMSLAKLGLPK